MNESIKREISRLEQLGATVEIKRECVIYIHCDFIPDEVLVEFARRIMAADTEQKYAIVIDSTFNYEY